MSKKVIKKFKPSIAGINNTWIPKKWKEFFTKSFKK